MIPVSRKLPVAAIALLLAVGSSSFGCEIGTDPNGLTDSVQFSTDIGLPEFEQALDVAEARVGVLVGDDLVARKVVILPTEMSRPEAVQGRVVALNVADPLSSLTLDLGGLSIQFDGETRFTVGEKDELSFDGFVARMAAALAEGREPRIGATRPAAEQPQAPHDPTFVAAHIRITDNTHEQVIWMNVNTNNLTINAAPPPDAWLRVLDVPIELRVRDGTTVIHAERDDLEKREFEGKVESVDLQGGTLKLANGPTIHIVDATEIKYDESNDRLLPTLAAVAQALREGETVVAWGVGAVESRDPPVLVAMHIAFAKCPPPMEDFEGVIVSVDLTARTATLKDETVIRLDDNTTIGQEPNAPHLLPSLEAVSEALREGRTVVAAGIGSVEAEHPLTILAKRIVFVLRPPDLKDFRGGVDSVDVNLREVYLDTEATIKITDDTEIWFEIGNVHGLADLAAVARALADGKAVVAAGVGTLESEVPFTIVAVKVAFIIQPVGVESFRGKVTEVDLVAESVTLDNGLVVLVSDETKIWFEEGDQHRLGSLEAVWEALEDGLEVVAAGVGTVEPTNVPTLKAIEIVFIVSHPGVKHFEGVVTSVDLEDRSFMLDHVTKVRIVEGTLVRYETGDQNRLGTLEAVDEFLIANVRVVAEGMGLVETSDPLVLIALTVVFYVP